MATFQDFKPIRNKLREFDAAALLMHFVDRLYGLRDFPIEKVGQQPPWYLLLLVKWTLLYSDFDANRRRAKGT